MTEIDLCFYEHRFGGARTDVGSGIHIMVWGNGDVAFEHVCAGIKAYPGEEGFTFRVAPLVISVKSETPFVKDLQNITCFGAESPCGRSGSVVDGIWIESQKPDLCLIMGELP